MLMNIPRIHLLIGPGTLHSRGHDRMDFTRYSKSGKPRMTGEELLEAVPEIHNVARVTVDAGNPHVVATLDEIRRLAQRVNALLQRDDVDGVVFVQGTNVLEETAYFLTLTVKSAKPVVVTGAQRPFTALSADAPLNLYDAFRVAADPQSAGKGVLVVTNNEINAARDVTKTNTYHVQTFRSRDVGVLGYADADSVVSGCVCSVNAAVGAHISPAFRSVRWASPPWGPSAPCCCLACCRSGAARYWSWHRSVPPVCCCSGTPPAHWPSRATC